MQVSVKRYQVLYIMGLSACPHFLTFVRVIPHYSLRIPASDCARRDYTAEPALHTEERGWLTGL
jgi:hypothetical protein